MSLDPYELGQDGQPKRYYAKSKIKSFYELLYQRLTGHVGSPACVLLGIFVCNYE